MKNNTIITVAVGASRSAQVWTNTAMRFADLAHRCRQCVITRETMAEFLAMSKDQQGHIKDVGGFVGGELRDGIRRVGHVVSRSVVCLDLDNATPDAWTRITRALPGTALFVYSTHKHTPQAPRLRLVVLLDRPVSEAGYEGVARAIAARVGEDMCDGTTYQPTRLMYWPSAPKDVPPLYLEQEGSAFSVDACGHGTPCPYNDDRNTVGTWRAMSTASDNSECTDAINRVPTTATSHVSDPRLKPGVVGAFCRAFSISAAIERFLPEVYAPAGRGRYTYRGASTTGGLTVYDDLHAYSWHDSDPASQRCCNAFDLVRIHLFGEGPDSFSQMCRLADNTPINNGDAPADAIERTASGNAVCTRHNIVKILQSDPRLAGAFARDEMTGNVVVPGPSGLPWDPRDPRGRVWDNADSASLRTFLEQEYGINSVIKVDDAFETVSMSRRFHAVRNYLEALQWDGVPRLDRCLIDYIGAADTELTRALTRIFLTAAVARVMEPGIKYDYCLILKGKQGVGKSTWLKILGGDYHKDGLTSMEGKEGAEQVRGSWIVELGELDSMRRTEVSAVKQFITQRVDEFRPAYARRKEVHPRQCVFAGTTNEDVFLKDSTGNRRFKIIEVGAVPGAHGADWFDALQQARDQIWAEAVASYRAGTPLYLSAELEALSREETRNYDFDTTDPLRGMLMEYLDMKMPYNWYTWPVEKRRQWLLSGGQTGTAMEAVSDEPRRYVCLVEFLGERLGKRPADRDYQSTALRVQRHLKALGWSLGPMQRHSFYGRQRTFFRPEQTTPADAV